MTVRVLAAGDRALLVETADLDAALALARALAGAGRPEVDDVVPATRTVLVRLAAGADAAEIGSWVLDLAASAAVGPGVRSSGGSGGQDAAPLEIPVRYDGPDLADVAALTGLPESEVVAAHTGTPWRAAFAGFAPGFAYLTGGDPRLAVPRRRESRTSVPAGSVALAGEFSAVYPRGSPGGWQLIGRTDATLWDVTADPPAAIRPGRAVRFVAIDRLPSDAERDGTGGVTGTGTAAAPAAPDRSAGGTLTVVRPGPLALVQDAGRAGYAADGVGRSGAADRSSLGLANRLVGNPAGAAAIECTLGGLAVRAGADLVVALAGAPAPAQIDGRPVEHARRLDLPAGAMLRLRAPRSGLRTYLAVGGGIDVPPVLGSRSTDTLSGLGPRPLAAGDVLPVGARSPADAGVGVDLDVGDGADVTPRSTRPSVRPAPTRPSRSARCPARGTTGSTTPATSRPASGSSHPTATGSGCAWNAPTPARPRCGAAMPPSCPARACRWARSRCRPAGSRWCSSPTTRSPAGTRWSRSSWTRTSTPPHNCGRASG